MAKEINKSSFTKSNAYFRFFLCNEAEYTYKTRFSKLENLVVMEMLTGPPLLLHFLHQEVQDLFVNSR